MNSPPLDFSLTVDVAPITGAVYLAWAEGWDVPVPLTVEAWAERYRQLPRESSSEPGAWRNSRAPHLVEPMQVLSDEHPCKKVVLMFGTQVGKTEVGNNWLGSSIHQTPSSMMVIQPTRDVGQRWVRQRFNPMVANCEELSDRIRPARSRDSGNTATMKDFPGGTMVVAWSNSAAGLSSMPVRRLFMDEVDRYPDDVDGEGHPSDVAERRTSSFPRRKILYTSTPTIKDESVIEHEFLLSDQRHRYVPCPECGHMQILQDENLSDDGEFLCEKGGHFFGENHKTKMLAAGEWRAHNPDGEYPGFHLPSYYAPIGLGYSWAEIVKLREAAKNNPQKKRTYANTIMAETYEDEGGKIDWKTVADRAGTHASRTIPDGCLMLTAGVDTQGYGWSVVIMGHGRGGRIWVVDWFDVLGEPAFIEEWYKLDEAILTPVYVNQYDVEMQVLATGIDTGGHNTHEAYQYCRNRAHKRVLAFKGSKYTGRPILPTRPSPQDINVNGQVIRSGVDLWHVGVDTGRGALFAKLNADDTVEPENQRFRFPCDLPDDFYQQLTNARFDGSKERWIKPRHKRHEGGDCCLYALAAASHPEIRVDKLRQSDWDSIEAKIQPVIVDLFAGENGQPEPVQADTDTDHDAPSAASVEAVGSQPQPQPEPETKNTHTARKPGRKKPKRGFVNDF